VQTWSGAAVAAGVRREQLSRQSEQTQQDEAGQAAKQKAVAKNAKDIAVATGV